MTRADTGYREDTIRMAREAGFDCAPDGHIYTDNHDGVCDEYLERFAALVAAAAKEEEREACAGVLDEMADDMVREMEPSTAVAYVRSKAAAIRARGRA